MGCCLLPRGANRRPRAAQQHRRNRTGTDVLDRESNGGLGLSGLKQSRDLGRERRGQAHPSSLERDRLLQRRSLIITPTGHRLDHRKR